MALEELISLPMFLVLLRKSLKLKYYFEYLPLIQYIDAGAYVGQDSMLFFLFLI